MRFQLDRTTLVFVLFIIILAVIFGANQFIQSQPPFEITIAVDPLAADWVEAAAQDYNDSRQLIANGTVRVQVNLIVTDDLDVWRNNPNWDGNNHPHGWIASSSASLDYVPPTLPFRPLNGSLARTPLVWGSFDSRLPYITDNDARPFDWAAVQDIAVAQRWSNVGVSNDSSFINMAIIWPTSSMAGLGAVMTSAADYGQTTTLDNTLLNSAGFSDWFTPLKDAMANSQRIGGNPAETMALRGTSTADFALLPESQWLLAYDDLAENGGVTFAYPAYQFILDFPVARWENPQSTDNELAAVASFADFLASEAGQALTVQHGLRPANSEPSENATLFTKALAKGIQLEPGYGQMLDSPTRGVADMLIGMMG